MLKNNGIYTLDITGYTSDGEGVGRIDGQVVFVPRTIAGERCHVRIVHQSNRIPRTETGATSCKVGHALFLGAQAAVMAVGAEPEWNEDTFDYKNQVGFEFGRIFGIAKSQFAYDGTNKTDFGCINVLTSSVDD